MTVQVSFALSRKIMSHAIRVLTSLLRNGAERPFDLSVVLEQYTIVYV